MQRFGFDHFGGPDVFQLVESAMPTAKPGQALLKVLGFGLNPYDAKLRAGEFAQSRPLPFPIVPGSDVLGQVIAVAEDVRDFAPGDLVINFRPRGGYSEYVTASATKLLLKPSALSMMDAAALPNTGMAAYSLLELVADRREDRAITVLGAAGGVGSLVVQLAQARGYRVQAIAATSHHPQLAALGLDTIADYADTALLPRTPIVIDCTQGGARSLLAPTLVASGGIILSLNPLTLPTGDYTTQSLTGFAPVQAAFNTLATVARTHGLTIRIAESLPWTLAGVQRGHHLLDAGHVGGKLVVMQPDSVLNAAHPDRNLL